MALTAYKKKRDFRKSPEPRGAPLKLAPKKRGSRSFVVQEHWARRHHYDFRLEMNGTLKSWAVPKKPSNDPKDRRLAVHVEDHPLAYGSFQGTIPEGQYGAGKVKIWDKGTWEPAGDLSARQMYKKGHLAFTLRGKKMRGKWNLVRLEDRGPRRTGKENWLLIKGKDDAR